MRTRVEFGVRILHEAGVPQGLEAPAHRGRRQAEGPREVSGRPRPVLKEFDRRPTVWIGHGGQSAVDAARIGLPHVQPVIFRPVAASASSRLTSSTVCPMVQMCPSGSLQR